jgi:Tol biopolymer transport system component
MVRCAAAVVCLLAVLGSTRPAEAQYFGRNKVHYDRLDFRVLQTEHFDLHYYAEEEQATRHAARMAERWYARFSSLLGHTFSRRQVVVLYASHPHFTQTNVTPAAPGEGVGGLTEQTRSRIAMPFAAGLGETDHVLGHEIAHAFQIDIARRAGSNAFLLPGWFIEGMAEYLSLGGDNANTMMWVRDAAAHKRLPTLKQLDNPRYFPYRYGHAFWAFLAERYGDGILGQMLRSKVRGMLPRLQRVTGLRADELTREWHAWIEDAAQVGERTEQEPAVIAAAANDGARIHVAPAISPDGRRVMFMSERDRLSLDLFMADTSAAASVRKIVSTAADPHFDSLQYIHSSGAWDPSGRRFAIAALSRGTPVLALVDSADPDRREEIRLDKVSEIYNPSWSPDGTRIVFSALEGGLSDLWIYSLTTKTIERLTGDAYADLHPAWSPDGRTIALATDRFTSDLGDLRFGALRVGLLDLATGNIRPLAEEEGSAKQVSPQWSPDGRAVYFVSDRGGISNIYRVEIASREQRQVTDVRGGVSGITGTSPALAVASQAGTLAFSVYRNGRYEIATLDESAALSARVVTPDEPATNTDDVTLATNAGGVTLMTGGDADTATSGGAVAAAGGDADTATDGDAATATSSAGGVVTGTLARLLRDPLTGLPEVKEFTSKAYDDRLRMESIAPQYIGTALGNGFGGVLQATFGFSFSDTLRDRQLHTMFRAGTDVDDLAAQIAYVNRKGQWNWGLVAGVVPSRFVGARRAMERSGALITRETAHLRYMHEWGGLSARYNINAARRLEFGAGLRRTGFEWQTVTRVFDSLRGKTLSQSLEETAAGQPIYLGEADAAYVHDTAVFGPTSPILGQRLRFEVDPAFGGLTFTDVRLDARRYVMPLRPVTLAARVAHIGRYGRDAGDARLTPLMYGLHNMVRGYDLRSFAADECGITAMSCSPLDELTGSRFALVNLEVRAPLLGLLRGDLYYGSLPIEAIAFADAGFLWTHHADGPIERDRFRSIGAGGRVNVGGFIFELTAVRPFDRPRAGWTANLLLRPGF